MNLRVTQILSPALGGIAVMFLKKLLKRTFIEAVTQKTVLIDNPSKKPELYK